MADNKTPHLNLPLPDEENLLEEDVVRLQDALTGLDAYAKKTNIALAAKADAAAVDASLAKKADAAAVNTALETKADAASTSAALALKAVKTDTDAALSTHAGTKSSTTVAAHLQLATDAEATAGTVTTKGVTPKQMKTATDAVTTAVTSAVTNASRADKAASYTSGGSSATATGFKLLSGDDIGALFGKVDTITVATSGSGAYVSNVAVTVSGKAATVTQTKVAATYCGYCTYCSHCAYCTHCTYCHCNCNCDCN